MKIVLSKKINLTQKNRENLTWFCPESTREEREIEGRDFCVVALEPKETKLKNPKAHKQSPPLVLAANALCSQMKYVDVCSKIFK